MRTAENRDGLRVALTGVVMAHLAAVLWHLSAHTHVPVALSALQTVYVTVVIAVLPVVGAVLLWANRRRAGAWLILLSMFGSLAFGFLNHYLLPSPDNVLALPPHPWRSSFLVSAGLLVVTATIGTTLGVAAVENWRRARAVGPRARVETTEPASAH